MAKYKKKWKVCIFCNEFYQGRRQEWCEKCDTPYFIHRAKETHGDKYDYGNSVYTIVREKLEIVCPEHGAFWQKPDNHIRGDGCPACANVKPVTSQEFIDRARKTHGDRYEYYPLTFVNQRTKTKIRCKIHGIFRQRPYSHARGEGCPACAGTKPLTTSVFIRRAKSVHGDTYDYECTEYKKISTNVTIRCRIHGYFEQLPIVHLKGGNCPKCSRKFRYTIDHFIEKATSVHGDRYDYSRVEFIDRETPVKIGCKKHGFFEQLPRNHVGGSGCPSCAGKQITTKDFLKRAKVVHGDRYDYSDVTYVRAHDDISIGCNVHGMFKQKPINHLSGVGCPVCGLKNRFDVSNFIKEASTLHNDVYDYSCVNYIDSKTRVVIICQKHGRFRRTPSSHLKGMGCPYCAGTRKITAASFIKNAKTLHPGNYEYEEAVYKNSNTKVKIGCKLHGFFHLLPGKHLSGAGCPKCSKNTKANAAEFIRKSAEVHHNKYSYKAVHYINSRTKVKIKCKAHGYFYQLPYHHKRGSGCPDCVGRRKLTTKTFIKRAIQIHGDRYDYQQVNYVNQSTKVTIICNMHGAFERAAGSHLVGYGCPVCAQEGRGRLT